MIFPILPDGMLTSKRLLHNPLADLYLCDRDPRVSIQATVSPELARQVLVLASQHAGLAEHGQRLSSQGQKKPLASTPDRGMGYNER